MDQFIFDAPCSYFDLRQDCLAQDENWFREVHSGHERSSYSKTRRRSSIGSLGSSLRAKPKKNLESAEPQKNVRNTEKNPRQRQAVIRENPKNTEHATLDQDVQVGRRYAGVVQFVAAPLSHTTAHKPTPKKRPGTIADMNFSQNIDFNENTPIEECARERDSPESQNLEKYANRLEWSKNTRKVKKKASVFENEDQELAELCAQHNQKFKIKAKYEPRLHSVQDVRQWEQLTGLKYYELSVAGREEANQQILQWKQEKA